MRMKIFFVYATLFFLGMLAANPHNNDDARAAQLNADIIASTHQ